MAYKLPAHLCRNRYGTLYFRLSIPAQFRSHFKQGEIYRSLGTTSIKAAAPTAQLLHVTLTRLFIELQQMDAENGKQATDAALEKLKVSPTIRDSMRVARLELALQEREKELEQREWEIVGIQERHAVELNAIKSVAGSLSTAAPSPKPQSPLMEEAAKAYIKEKTVRGKWTAKTLEKRKMWFDQFRQFMRERIGRDPRMDEIDKDAVTDFLALLQKLPPNISKNYPDKPLSEIAALGLPPLASSSINGHMGFLSGFFTWCKEHPRYRIDYNPAFRLNIEERPNRELRAFTNDELIAFFSSPEFKHRTFLHPHYYWLIPMALHTGARLGELCQLSLSDFVEKDGIHCIHIQDGREDQQRDDDRDKKRVKNANAIRLVPVHSFLIEIGLLRYVEAMKRKGAVRLFPEIDLSISSSQEASKWFNDRGRYSDKCGVTDPDTNFHSFRRTFITRAIKTNGGGGANERQIASIVGHEHGLITLDVYFDDDAQEGQATVEKFQLPPEIRALIPAVEEVTFGKGPPRKRRAKTKPQD